ncbi:MAG: glucose-6-phosphate isomerase [Proteobacteria bacterium]|nr:glucose-6-phosphate isomerase [Pseudomonadota bacterium]
MFCPTLNKRPAWKVLEKHRKTLEKTRMRDLFAADSQRFDRFSLSAGGLFLDYSKNRITDNTMPLLYDLAKVCGVEEWRNRMFAGEKINISEDRPVLHTALRRPAGDSVTVDSENIMPFIHGTLSKMEKFSRDVRSGTWKGHTGKKITDIVNIGIGGSDLGPRMVCRALRNEAISEPAVHFVSNVDGTDIQQTLRGLSPETTLFIVASKTFTTQETMANAQTARQWLLSSLKEDKAVARHFTALSVNADAAVSFGIPADNLFPFRDWVGGRYSLWSAIGLSICLEHGFDAFRDLLRGAYEMDTHFRAAPLNRNMPVILALLGIWYRNFWKAQCYAVLPYAQNLSLFPAWLQQVDMESNGKSASRNGNTIFYETGPAIFGTAGTDCQHSFFQLIHQGTDIIPCDFIGVKEPMSPHTGQHKMLLANMAAQGQALMEGRDEKSSVGNPHRSFSGNRPSNTLIMERLDARHLGMLLALYEHKIFVQGIIWSINSFDQWGVELGKILTSDILNGKGALDSSTRGILQRFDIT